MPHPECNWFGNSVIVSYLYESNNSPMNYMPIQRVVCQCAHTSIEIKFSSGTEQGHSTHKKLLFTFKLNGRVF